MIQERWSQLPANLEELKKSMTHREYLTRLAWIKEQEEQPRLSDYYSMQIACEVRRVLSKDPNKIQLKDFLLQFGSPQKKRSTLVESKAAWASFLGKYLK